MVGVATGLKRYELFGWDYEYLNPVTEEEVAWYVGWARKTGGPVLELACGTARLLVAIAEAGFEVQGIDLSPRMLEMARRRLSRLPAGVASRVLLHRADMTRFRLRTEFGLIVLADNSFRELTTEEGQLSCLECAQRHLRSDGRLLVTVRRFDASSLQSGRAESGWSEAIPDPVTGDLVKRRVETYLMQKGKRIRTAFSYRIAYGDGTDTLEECVSEAPMMIAEDYVSLFSRAGFRTRAFVGYEERADDGSDPILCFVCEKGQ